MSLPSAVARGAAAETSIAVHPGRVGIVVGVLAALVLFAVYMVAPAPTRLTGLLGSGSSDLAQRGGLRMTWLPPVGVDPRRLEKIDAGARKDGDAYVIEVPGVREDDVLETAKELAGGHELAFRRVIRAPETLELIRTLQLTVREAPPASEIDAWSSEDGERRIDHFVIGESYEQLRELIAQAVMMGWQLPPGLRIAFEPYGTWNKYPALWRTYIVREQAELDGDDIAAAEVMFDPDTNRPLVLLDFTKEGAAKFATLTEAMVGEKLATMRGDLVMSAPIIMGPIRGGRASISMGGNDKAAVERDARILAGTLRARALPAGGTLRSATYVPATSATTIAWFARGVIAVGGGLLLGLVAWAVVRRTRPVRARLAATAPGGVPWSRIAVTLLAPLTVVGASFIPVFGLDGLDLPEGVRGASWNVFNLGMLGVVPVVSAYILVEIVAVIVPAWRRRRHAGDAARRPFAQIVPGVALVLAALQAWMLVHYLEELFEVGAVSPLALGDPGIARLPFIGSLLAGVALYVLVAEVIRRWGLGNGYGAILASAWLARIIDFQLDGAYVDDSIQVLFLVAPLVILVVGIALARWRIAPLGELALRLPVSGSSPVGHASGVLLVLGVLAALPTKELAEMLHRWTFDVFDHRSFLLLLVVATTVGWSAAFARGRRLQRIASRAGLVGPTPGAWLAATMLTTAALLALVAMGLLVEGAPGAGAAPGEAAPFLVLNIAMGLATAAVLLDAAHDLRGRRIACVRVWALHQPHLADAVAHSLTEVDISCHLSGGNLRAMLSFFGPFAPIDVYVRPEDATRAHAKITELLPIE